MSLFTKVAAKKVDAPKAKTKGTPWLAGDPNGDAVAKSVKALVALDSEVKAIEAKMGLHKTVVKKYAEDRYVRDFASKGVNPETPLYVQTSDGEKVTFIVQDRSGQYGVRAEQKDAVIDLVGEDAASGLLYEEAKFGFNRDLLAIEGVKDVIGAALETALQQLLDSNLLSSEQAEQLLEVDTKTAFKPGTLDRMALIVGRDTTRMKQLLEIMGSSATRYIKV